MTMKSIRSKISTASLHLSAGNTIAKTRRHHVIAVVFEVLQINVQCPRQKIKKRKEKCSKVVSAKEW